MIREITPKCRGLNCKDPYGGKILSRYRSPYRSNGLCKACEDLARSRTRQRKPSKRAAKEAAELENRDHNPIVRMIPLAPACIDPTCQTTEGVVSPDGKRYIRRAGGYCAVCYQRALKEGRISSSHKGYERYVSTWSISDLVSVAKQAERRFLNKFRPQPV